jgi:hypothetical protein
MTRLVPLLFLLAAIALAQDDDDAGPADATVSPDAGVPAPDADVPSAGLPNPNQGKLDDAMANRKAALATAIEKLRAVRKAVADGTTPNDPAVPVIKSWLNTSPGDDGYVDVLDLAIDGMQKNQDAQFQVNIAPDSHTNDMCNDCGGFKDPNACATGTEIAMCNTVVAKTDSCRAVVLIHEVFHTVGWNHITEGKGAKTFKTSPALTPSEATGDPGYMAGLAWELKSGVEENCR